MKRFFNKFMQAMCVVFAYLFSGFFVTGISLMMVCSVMPISVSVFVSFLGFSEEATATVVILMSGFPLLFLTGLFLYGTIRFLHFGCRHIIKYFYGIRTELQLKLEGDQGDSESASDDSKDELSNGSRCRARIRKKKRK